MRRPKPRMWDQPLSAPDVALPSELPATPLTAGPGTPVGHLLNHPVMQHALQRAQGHPLAMLLGRQGLVRGQPADFLQPNCDRLWKGAAQRQPE